MRLAVIGKGKIVKDFLSIRPQLPISAMALMVRPEALEAGREFAAENGFEAVFTDMEGVAGWKPDAVYVAVPNHLHYRYARQALEAGLSVILEKPTVPRLRELEALYTLADAKGLYLIEAMTTWYLPAFNTIRENLSKLGRLRLVQLTYCQRSSRYDAFRNGQVSPAFSPEAAGGSLMDINVYNIAAAVALFGAPESIRYEANIVRGIDTGGVLTMVYPDFMVTATGAKDCGLMAGGSFLGDEGSLHFDGPVSLVSAFTIRQGGSTQVIAQEDPPFRMQPEFLAFPEILAGRREEEYRRLRKNSFIVAEILEQARHQAGIVFPGDTI